MRPLYFLFFLFAINSLSAQVYVKKDATGANNGTSWQNAYTDLETALDNTSSGELWVAQGVYSPGGASPDSSSVFPVSGNVALYGGFVGTETSLSQRDPDAHPTILSGDILGDDLSGEFAINKEDNTQHVVYIDSLISSGVILDGFTIKGGNTSDYSTQPEYFYRGGGIFALSPVEVNNCIFEQNFGRSGAAIYLTGGASGSMINLCDFFENYTTGQSAGIFANTVSDVMVQNCSFTFNLTNRGALYPLYCTNFTVDNCIFEANINETGFGGAMFIWNPVNMTLSNSIFSNNKATNGGAINYNGSELSGANSDNFVIENCSFTNNSTTDFGGGGIYNTSGSFSVIDCIFDANAATNGAHIFNNAPGNVVYFENTNFVNGDASGWGNLACYGLNASYIFDECLFDGNTANNLGGAVNNGFGATSTFDACTFNNNTSLSSAGGALALQNDSTKIIVLNSSFTNNKSSSNGGAIFSGASESSSLVAVDNSIFTNNESTGGFGGAIHISEGGDDDISSLILNNSQFYYNKAADQGGALNLGDSDATITNCVFSTNTATGMGRGGAIANNASDSNHVELLIMNTTIADNAGMFSSGLSNWTGTIDASSNTTLQNTIFRQDGTNNYAIEDGTPEIISNGGNFADDATLEDYFTHPKDIINETAGEIFVNSADQDYHLKDGAFVIDAGVSDGAPEFDIEGNARINEVDMGAYENQNVTGTDEVLLNNDGMLSLSPNPATGQYVTLTLENQWSGTMQLRLTNMAGQVVSLKEVEKTDTSLKMEMPLTGIKTGFYNLAVSNGKEVIVVKMIRF